MDSRDIDDAQDLDQAVRTISLWARDTDNFTQIVSRWLQCPVEYVLLSQSRRTVTEEHATALDIPIDSVALHRHGLLQVTSPGSPIVVADVRATVVERRLSERTGGVASGKDTAGGCARRVPTASSHPAVTRQQKKIVKGSRRFG